MTHADPWGAAPDSATSAAGAAGFVELGGGGDFGRYPKPNDLLGRLLYFAPIKMDRIQKSEQYIKAGDDPMQDVIRTFCAVLDGADLEIEDKEGARHTFPIVAEFDNMIWGQSPVINALKPALAKGGVALGRLRRYPQKNSPYKTPEDVEAAFEAWRQQIIAGKNADAPRFAWVLEKVVGDDVAKGVAYHNKRLAELGESVF